MITNAGEDEIPPETRVGPKRVREVNKAGIGCGMTREIELQRLNENGGAAFIGRAPNADGLWLKVKNRAPLQWTRTRPPPWMAVSMNPFAL